MLLLNTPIINIGDILGITDQGFRTLFRIAVASRVKQRGSHVDQCIQKTLFFVNKSFPRFGPFRTETRLATFYEALGNKEGKRRGLRGHITLSKDRSPSVLY